MLVLTRRIESVLKDESERIDLTVKDDAGDPVDASELSLSLRDLSSTLLYGPDDISDPDTRIVKLPDTTGKYYFEIGNPDYIPEGETSNLETYYTQTMAVRWRAVGEAGSEPVTTISYVQVYSLNELYLATQLRARLDKAMKPFSDDEDHPCYIGYSDDYLLQYIRGGLHVINFFQPYPVWNCVEDFLCNASMHLELLYMAAEWIGIGAQLALAIDADIAFQDQANSFTIDHKSPLAAYRAQLWTELSTAVPLMKRHYLRNGTVSVSLTPNSIRSLVGWSGIGNNADLTVLGQAIF